MKDMKDNKCELGLKPEFICHPDFSELTPINVFHKEDHENVQYTHPEELKNKHILFRKKLSIDKPEKAVLKISADDHFKLYINGEFITEGPAPGYPLAYYYCELDVTKYLKSGENTFAVHTYYQGLINRVWVSGDLRQMLYFELACGGETLCVSDTDWKCAYHTGYTECGRFGYETAFAECYDSASPEVGFELPGFDDSGWENAAVYQNADYILVKQPTKQLDIYTVRPYKTEKSEGSICIDFGQEMVGYLSVCAKGKAGETVLLCFGEELNPDGSVRYDMRCNCRYEERWLLSGKEDILSQYDYKAFRYAELHFAPGTEIYDIKMTVRHYPFVLKAKYSTESEALKKILKLCESTIKYGTQEGFMDCPTREKGQYLGDVSIAARAHAVMTGDTALMKKAITDFCRSSFVCPGIMSVAPASLMQEIADYSLQLPAQILWTYSIDGDREFLAYTEPYIRAETEYFKRFMNEDCLLDQVDKWNLVDWPQNLRDGYDFPLPRKVGRGLHNVINAFWYGFLKDADKLFDILGKEKTGLTDKAGASFKKAFYNQETGLYTDSPVSKHTAIHSAVLPLLFGLCDGDKPLKERIIKLIREKGLYSMGVYMAYFTLAALVREGKEDDALKLTEDPRCWLNMLSEGATTTFEAWGKDQKWNTSLFHPWACAPAIIFADGVQPY